MTKWRYKWALRAWPGHEIPIGAKIRLPAELLAPMGYIWADGQDFETLVKTHYSLVRYLKSFGLTRLPNYNRKSKA